MFSQAAKQRIQPGTYRRPGSAVIRRGYTIGRGIGSVLKAFNQCQGDDDRQNQAQDDKAIPWPMQEAGQLFRANDSAAKGEKEQGNEHKYDECVQYDSKGVVLTEERQ